jgi:hypothetical protein
MHIAFCTTSLVRAVRRARASRTRAAASLKLSLQIGVGVDVEDQPRLPLSLIPVADLLEQAARARRLAIAIDGDPAALRLVDLAENWRLRSPGCPVSNNPAASRRTIPRMCLVRPAGVRKLR